MTERDFQIALADLFADSSRLDALLQGKSDGAIDALSPGHRQRLFSLIERDGTGVRFFAELLERKNRDFAKNTTPVLFGRVGQQIWEELWAVFHRRNEEREGASEPLEQLREFISELPGIAQAANAHIADLKAYCRVELTRLRAAGDPPPAPPDVPISPSNAFERSRPIRACRAPGSVARPYLSSHDVQDTAPTGSLCLVACRPRLDGSIEVVRLLPAQIRLLRLCDGTLRVHQLACKLSGSQDAPPSRLTEAVQSALGHFVSLGLVEPLPESA